MLVRVLTAVAIAISSLLLFVIQPMMAKLLLPRFGGSAGVWLVSMLFFQTALLAGYLYSFLVTRWVGGRTQRMLHLALLAASLALAGNHGTAPADQPLTGILLDLTRSIGLPFLLLSANSPLLQSWLAESTAGQVSWRLFALSNVASLLALVAYPFVIEPLLPLSAQVRAWRIGYVGFAVLAGAAGLASLRGRTSGIREASRPDRRVFLWAGLAACASMLWLSVANHLSQEVAPVPFLWILPLAIYLLSFILCFERDGWYRPQVFRWLLPVAWAGAAWWIAGRGPDGIGSELAVFGCALFIWCMFCHGEIAATKPNADGMPVFYLAIAAGGALGGVLVAVVAPIVFSSYLELPVAVAVSVIIALPVLYGLRSVGRLLRIGGLAAAAFIVAIRFQTGIGDVARIRNFYGAIQVSDSGEGKDAVRAIYSGRTLHGVEFTSPDRLNLATGYYSPESGAGRLLLSHERPMRVALVGLGAGTLATYSHSGDELHFFEINPAVIDAARRYFQFLARSEGTVSVTAGDGRLALAGEKPSSFDVLILDAFSDDSIPVHLLTREAFQLYFRALKRDGVLAVHVTNRYLNLVPIVEALAADAGKEALEYHNRPDPERQVLAADWIVVSPATGPVRRPGGPIWTDDYSNLFSVLK